jgi:cysteine sulfinate desulfinase/cysteine desulfurase-like protein
MDKGSGFGDSSSSGSGGSGNGGIIAAAINAIVTFFSLGAAKKANKAATKTAEQQKAEALAIAGASALNAESLRLQKNKLVQEQKDNLAGAIKQLKDSSVKGWKDEISEMETKLKDEDFTTYITNLPHKGLRGKSKVSFMNAAFVFIDAFNTNTTKLLGVIVAMKDKGVADNDPVTNNTPDPDDGDRTANFQKYLPYIAGIIIAIILFRRNS